MRRYIIRLFIYYYLLLRYYYSIIYYYSSKLKMKYIIITKIINDISIKRNPSTNKKKSRELLRSRLCCLVVY